MTGPYFDDGQVVLYHGDCREVMWQLNLTHVGVVITDPPYGETSLEWDRWPDGWLELVADITRSMWCFGSMRMFLAHGREFTAAGWKFAQDIVWRKNNGTGFADDRFRRIHESVTHWYRGPWGDVRHVTPRTRARPEQVARNGSATRTSRPQHWGDAKQGTWTDDGTRLMPSVFDAPSCHGYAIHPTQKPLGIIDPLLRYSLAPGGTVLDPFAGSGSTLVAAREAGYRAIGIEADEAMCAKAVEHRLAQGALAFGAQA